MKRFFKKAPGGVLIPAFDEDAEWVMKKKTGALLEVDIREPRNGKLHRKWWSLCNYLAENSDRFPSAEHASKWLLIRLGFCTYISESRNPRSNSFPIADSISFAKMDDDEFQKVYDRACDLLCEIIPHVADENVKQVLEGYAGIGGLEGMMR